METIKRGSLTNKFTFLSLLLYVIYIIWYQSVINSINGFLPIMGIAMVIFALSKMRMNISFYKYAFGIVLFVFFAAFSSFVNSSNLSFSLSLCLNIIEYNIPLLVIINYVGNNKRKYYNIVGVLCFTVALISVSSIISPTIVTNGAISVGTLNTNVLSTYIMVGVLCNFILFNAFDNLLLRVVMILITAIEFVVQINCASRRGIIVLLILIFGFFHTMISIKLKKKTISKLALFTVIALIVVHFAFFSNMLSESILFARFKGAFNEGDLIREIVQETAIDLFKNHPILGAGAGAIQIVQGTHSHSMYHETLGCFGLVGFIILVLSFASGTLIMYRQSKLKSEIIEKSEFRILFWGMISSIISGFAVVNLYEPIFYLWLACIVSYLNVSLTRQGSNTKQ